MTAVLSTILVLAAGGIGAMARFVVDGVFARRWSEGPFPLGIVVVNIIGSFVLGAVTGLASGGLLGPEAARVVGVGLCGGFTTFSTASLEAVKLWAEEGFGRTTAYTALTLVGAVTAAWVGLAITEGS